MVWYFHTPWLTPIYGAGAGTDSKDAELIAGVVAARSDAEIDALAEKFGRELNPPTDDRQYPELTLDNRHWRAVWPVPVQGPGEKLLEKSMTYLVFRKLFTDHADSVNALNNFAQKDDLARSESRIAQVKKWLEKATVGITEDHVSRLRLVKSIGDLDSEIPKYAKELLRLQRSDGGWAPLEKMESDAYSTATALLVSISKLESPPPDKRAHSFPTHSLMRVVRVLGRAVLMVSEAPSTSCSVGPESSLILALPPPEAEAFDAE